MGGCSGVGRSTRLSGRRRVGGSTRMIRMHRGRSPSGCIRGRRGGGRFVHVPCCGVVIRRGSVLDGNRAPRPGLDVLSAVVRRRVGLDVHRLNIRGLDTYRLRTRRLSALGLSALGLSALGLSALGLNVRGLDTRGLDARRLDARARGILSLARDSRESWVDSSTAGATALPSCERSSSVHEVPFQRRSPPPPAGSGYQPSGGVGESVMWFPCLMRNRARWPESSEHDRRHRKSREAWATPTRRSVNPSATTFVTPSTDRSSIPRTISAGDSRATRR